MVFNKHYITSSIVPNFVLTPRNLWVPIDGRSQHLRGHLPPLGHLVPPGHLVDQQAASLSQLVALGLLREKLAPLEGGVSDP